MIYKIETTTIEQTVTERDIDEVINGFILDGYKIINDDTNEVFGDLSGPVLVYYKGA